MDFSHHYPSQSGAHDFGNDLPDQQQQLYHEFEQQQLLDLQDPTSAMYAMSGAQAGQRASCGDAKPRLSKEQHDILEAHYQKQQKPNTSTKRGFAESLNVSLEKVNNWFQNRRAKSKQDAKKQQETVGIFDLHGCDLNPGSDSETSPAFASADYQQMMQHFSQDEEAQAFEQHQSHAPIDIPQPRSRQVANYNLLYTMTGDMMSDSQEMNRRTMTQEQFDAFGQPEMLLNSGHLAMLSHNPEAMERILAAYTGNQQQSTMSMPSDSVIAMPTTSNPAFLHYPLARMEEQVMSTTSSDWTGGSRSSSVSLAQSGDLSTSMSSQQSVSQWQPGQSVPVDFHQLNEEFQKAAQSRQESLPTDTMVEPSVSWLDNMYRPDSSASIVQHMGNVGLHTPQPPQQSVFKIPTPVSSLAARRQKQRPTPLGLASLRSQSYSGTDPLGSPQFTHQQSTSIAPQLRRIKSSNVVGGIATGRVQKSIAMPQRSPLSWNFNSALTSPQAVRHHSSQSALAPPTPMSPPEQTTAQQMQQQQQQHQHQQQQWQSSSGPVLQQDSISETDAEHQDVFATTQNFTSPPHTPMFHNQPQQFLPPQFVHGNVIMENTPPQSAPASQQCFAQTMYTSMPMQQQIHQQYFIPQPQPAPQLFQQQFMHHMTPQEEQQQYQQQPQHQHMPAAPQFTITTSGPPMDMPMQFAQHGMPIVDAQGHMQLAMPSQVQFLQQKPSRPEQQAHKVHPKFSPGGTQLIFSASPDTAVPLQVTSQVPKHAAPASSDFFVHEYTPPQDLKQAATPRKPESTGPKNYTFANHTSQHFEKAAKKAEAKSSTGNTPDTA